MILSREILHLFFFSFLVLSLIGLNYIYLYGDTSVNICLSASFFRVVLVQRMSEKRTKAKVLHALSLSICSSRKYPLSVFWASRIVQLVKNPSAMQENDLKERKVIQIKNVHKDDRIFIYIYIYIYIFFFFLQ